MSRLIFVQPAQLLTHPRNMRRFYPAEAVRRMAASIKAKRGLIQPLRLIPGPKPKTYYVVVGNLRTAAGHLLGEACPPLKAEVITNAAEVEHMLEMVIENTQRLDVDPISEGLHYQALQAQKLTPRQIADRTGVGYQRVLDRLELIQLDQPIQDLIANGQFHSDMRVARALLAIKPAQARIRLAQRLAKANATIRVCLSACERLQAALAQPAKPTEQAPMLAHAHKRQPQATKNRALVPNLRAAAQQMCSTCTIKADELEHRFPEPAWTLLTQRAEGVCQHCNLRDLNVCHDCPGVELLTALYQTATHA